MGNGKHDVVQDGTMWLNNVQHHASHNNCSNSIATYLTMLSDQVFIFSHLSTCFQPWTCKLIYVSTLLFRQKCVVSLDYLVNEDIDHILVIQTFQSCFSSVVYSFKCLTKHFYWMVSLSFFIYTQQTRGKVRVSHRVVLDTNLWI